MKITFLQGYSLINLHFNRSYNYPSRVVRGKYFKAKIETVYLAIKTELDILQKSIATRWKQ